MPDLTADRALRGMILDVSWLVFLVFSLMGEMNRA